MVFPDKLQKEVLLIQPSAFCLECCQDKLFKADYMPADSTVF